MRYFVQPFSIFGEDDKQKFSDEFYMRALSKVEHIRSHIGKRCFNEDGTLNEKKYLQECSTYHGSGQGHRSICLFPGGNIEMQYAIFFEFNPDRGKKEHPKQGTYYFNKCELKIWLDKKDVLKLFNKPTKT